MEFLEAMTFERVLNLLLSTDEESVNLIVCRMFFNQFLVSAKIQKTYVLDKKKLKNFHNLPFFCNFAL